MQLIIPAFNEERRLPPALRALRAFVVSAAEALGPVEVIVVDNGSTDATAARAAALDSDELPVRVLGCATRGKGAAVRAGVAASSHEVIGYLDADGATDLTALLAARDLLHRGVDLAVGSRALGASVTYERHNRVRVVGASAYRYLTRKVDPGIHDSQCGFKLMRGDLARRVFASTRCNGFSFDVELIGRFQREGAVVEEFPVVWVDVPGSTFVPARDGLAAFGSLALIAMRLRGIAPSAVRDAVAITDELTSSVSEDDVVRVPELAGTRVAVLNWRDPWHSQAGGSERYAWHCASALHDAGAIVEFVTARDDHQGQGEVRDGIRLRRGGRQYSFYLYAWWHLLTRRLSGRGYDVVIDTEAGIPAFSPIVVARRTPVVLVVHHVHQDQFGTYLPPHLAMLARFMEGRLMPLFYRGVTTFAVSESTRQEMVGKLGWNRPVQIVHNGADTPPTTTTSRSADRLVVLSRLTTHKRIDLVIRAVAHLAAERPALRLDIVGKGVDQDRLRGLVSDLGLEDKVTLHGFLSEHDKHEVVGSAALHVCASDIEGWGQVVIEAAALGVPTLARDVPGLRDSIRDGETGWLVRTSGQTDEEVLGAIVNGIRDGLSELDEPSTQAEIAERCRTWADKFSWSAMHQQVVTTVATELESSRSTWHRSPQRSISTVVDTVAGAHPRRARPATRLLAFRRHVGRT
jgi:glycosyltransferase involved in cell wall biosynthesis